MYRRKIMNVMNYADRKNVDYGLSWDVGHRGDYDLPQLFSWIEEICSY